MPALEPYIIEPIFEQFEALLPERSTSDHPLGCHRPRIPDRVVVFAKLVEVLVLGCAYDRIAEASCSESTLRRRRDEWIGLLGLMERLREISLDAYDRLIGLELADLAVDGCITKAPWGGEKARRSPVDRGKGGVKRSTQGRGRTGHPAWDRRRPGQPPRFAAIGRDPGHLVKPFGELPDRASVHLDRAYDSQTTRPKLAAVAWSARSPRRASRLL